jgi:hypothetical protein
MAGTETPRRRLHPAGVGFLIFRSNARGEPMAEREPGAVEFLAVLNKMAESLAAPNPLLERLVHAACQALTPFGNNARSLRALATFVSDRI